MMRLCDGSQLSIALQTALKLGGYEGVIYRSHRHWRGSIFEAGR